MTTLAPPTECEEALNLKEIDTARAKLVYLALVQTEARTADDLSSLLDLQKITLFDVLSALADRGLIERDGQYCTPVTTKT